MLQTFTVHITFISTCVEASITMGYEALHLTVLFSRANTPTLLQNTAWSGSSEQQIYCLVLISILVTVRIPALFFLTLISAAYQHSGS